MQTITPEHMLDLSIGIFMDSDEVLFLVDHDSKCLLLDFSSPGTMPKRRTKKDLIIAETLDRLCVKAEWLETLANQLHQIRANLAPKMLAAELRLSEGDPQFMQATCSDVKDCLVSAYGRKPSPRDIGVAYFAVLIRDKSSNAVVSAALADFRPFPDNEFATRMEAVRRERQRQGIARELFRFIEASTRFLLRADGFVRINTAAVAGDPPLPSSSGVVIKSCVDCDAPEWHAGMMLKFGYEEDAGEEDDDVEFSKKIH